MNEIQLHKMQEDEGFGAFLLSAVAGIYECKPEASLIEKYVFKYTDCGAWIKFDAEGIMVGTIVEGSEAEFSERVDVSGVELSEEGEEVIRQRVRAILQKCEDFAEEVWHEKEAECD